jgi:hypothetical protein
MKKRRPIIVIAMVAWTGVCAAQVGAGTIVRDFSGEAMQRHDSRMRESPMNRIPTLLGMSFWPFNPYFYAPPSLTVVNVEIHMSAPDQPTTPQAASVSSVPARPKFWTNRCGVFLEIEVSGKTNLMEEEEKPC